MRKIAFADLVREWEARLAAVDDNQDKLTGAAQHRARLQGQLDEIKEVKARQDGARALQQVCTKRLAELAAEGQVAAIQLRGAVRSFLDPRSEGLVQFGIAPLRRRGRRSYPLTDAATPPAPDEGAGGPAN
jgi:hypothetical protein